MTAQRTIARRAVRQESGVLLRQLESYLTNLRADDRRDGLAHAERMADSLRRVIADTADAGAVDRARVRSAVHYFVSQDAATGPTRARTGGARYALLAGARVERRPEVDGDSMINDLLRQLGRSDLVVD